MKVTRYAGLPEKITKDDADKIIRGGFNLGTTNNSVQYSTLIPLSGNNVYQLGWGFITYFKWNGTAFDSFKVGCFKRLDRFKNSPTNEDRVSTVVTRGVQTCTAVAILRGNAMCLLHFDESDINSKDIDGMINNIISHLRTGSGNIFICASYIDDKVKPSEEKFVNNIIQTCQTTFTDAIITKRISNRGAVDANLLTHLEFGIGLDEDTKQPIVFGDVYSNNSCERFGFDTDGVSLENNDLGFILI